VQLNDSKNVDESEIKEVPINDFILPPRGDSQVQDFDLLAHIEDEIIKEDDSDASGADDFDEEEAP